MTLHTATSDRRRMLVWPTELWTEIARGLYMGGTHDDDTIMGCLNPQRTKPRPIGPRDFQAVTTMYARANPVDWEVAELRWTIMDSELDGVDMQELLDTVRWTHAQWRRGKKTLIRCQAGMNRSGLVTAGVLIRDGWEPIEALDLIRRTRSVDALFNRRFEDIILDTPADFWR